MENGLIPIIIILTYMFIELLKLILKSKEWLSKVLPIFAGLFGGLIGVCIYLSAPSLLNVSNIWGSLEIGIISGLASTGTNQIIKKVFGGA